ncbi:MAG: type II toxin-antitoxin system HicB family antitoxin [Egibacteraceae bacterium]
MKWRSGSGSWSSRTGAVEVHRGEDGYVATIVELPGCVTAAETWGE